MSATGWRILENIQRRISLRVASAYCTTSKDAIGVIAPLDLLAKDRKIQHNRKRDPAHPLPEETTMVIWQRRWDNIKKGRWHINPRNQPLDK